MSWGHNVGRRFAVALAFLVPGMLGLAQTLRVTVNHVRVMPNVNHPELLYYFVDPTELQGEKYLQTIDDIIARGPFDFIFLTQRDGTDFYDYAKMRPIFTKLVAEAHAKGVRVGLQLWSKEKEIPLDKDQAILVDAELPLDTNGNASYTAVSRGVRIVGFSLSDGTTTEGKEMYSGTRSELVRVYAFKKTADGEYASGSVRDITDRVQASPEGPETLRLAIHGGAALDGYTAYVMTAHYHKFPDMFSDFLPENFSRALHEYKACGFDGTALDEFRYMTVGRKPHTVFRERMYSRRMGEAYEKRTGKNLERALFDMRYSPSGDPAVRIAAINTYFDVLRQGVLSVEESFAKTSTEVFGPNTFHGIHDTFHNGLDNDEVWQTGINWWAVPRDYGQSDETTPMVTRVGIGLGHPKTIEYNQYYTKDISRFEQEPIIDARYNDRVHYHALNDTQGWGIDLRKPELLIPLTAIERKVRLLNYFDAPRLDMQVLVIFGFPALTDWYPDTAARNEWDINGKLMAEKKAAEVWDAGYRSALVPSYLIDSGEVRLDGSGGVIAGSHRFSAVVYIGPQYADEKNLEFLQTYVAQGGKLMLDGTATRNFYGGDISARFARISAKAVATSFDVAALPKLGIAPNAIPDGALYEDGSVILTDLDSAVSGKARSFELKVGGHLFAGSYAGVLGIKVDARGQLEKLAGGSITTLREDGREILRTSEPSDLFLHRTANGYEGVSTGQGEITMH